MARILPNGRRPLGCAVAICLGLASLLGAGTAHATTQEDPPDGLPAGPVFFAPWFQTEVLGDDNIFRRSEEQQLTPIDGLSDEDISTTLRGGVTAYVPVRMSLLEFGYEGSTFFYKDSNFSGTDRHTGFASFDLNFSSYNTLRVEESYTDGHTELQRQCDAENDVSCSEEIIRQGIPFASNTWAVEWFRQIDGKPSWRARVEQSYRRYHLEDLEVSFDVPWPDYEAWDVEYEYRQPIYRRGVMIGRYAGRREDQFNPNEADSPFVRNVDYDTLEVGFNGLVGRKQPLLVRIGYGELALGAAQGTESPSDFKGIVGNMTWRLPLGGVSNLAVHINRLPLSSIYNTYYMINELRVRFDRRFREVSRWGVNLLGSSNHYGDIITSRIIGETTLECLDVNDSPTIRHDRNRQVEGFWEWFVMPRASIRVSATHSGRNSNCGQIRVDEDGNEYKVKPLSYDSNAIGMTFRVGWF